MIFAMIILDGFSRLSNRTRNQELREAFAKFDHVIHDRMTKYTQGFGFVIYANLEHAEKGIKGREAQVVEGFNRVWQLDDCSGF
ncbi:Uncharacterized protein TCM_021967 [Theobroma cacao]|uniref:RRM domain-containing protein n=1 Tax=Theobroma cacao TaxID=3641 RepID=A0A061EZ64_THECC|nr:Uncharacterized protein TCM_021967 [Theobroma cacao]